MSVTSYFVGMPLTTVLAFGAVFVGVFAVVIAMSTPLFTSRGRTRALEIAHYATPESALGRLPKPTASSMTSSFVAFGDKVMKDRESTSRIMALLQQADLPLRPGEWWALRMVALAVGAVGGAILLNAIILLGLALGAIVGILAPEGVLRLLAKRRRVAFERQLPDVLTLVASSLTTGFSLLQALDSVARDSAEPAAKEFSRALAETRIGADIDEALERLSVRMGSESMSWMAMVIRIQREVGGNLAESLRTTAVTVREREGLQRHVRALSAEGRLSAYILVALPIGLFFYTLKVNYEYVQILWTTFPGICMSVYAIVSLIVGILVMRKVIEVKV